MPCIFIFERFVFQHVCKTSLCQLFSVSMNSFIAKSTEGLPISTAVLCRCFSYIKQPKVRLPWRLGQSIFDERLCTGKLHWRFVISRLFCGLALKPILPPQKCSPPYYEILQKRRSGYRGKQDGVCIFHNLCTITLSSETNGGS